MTLLQHRNPEIEKQKAAKDAPGRKGRLAGVTVQYKILNDAKTATLKVWGYD